MDVQVTHGHLIIRSQEHHVWLKGREVDGKGSGGKGRGETVMWRQRKWKDFVSSKSTIHFPSKLERERERESEIGSLNFIFLIVNLKSFSSTFPS